MTIFRLILADWASSSGLPKVKEGHFDDNQLHQLNSQGYNVYYLPNYPRDYKEGSFIDGRDIDTFDYVFVDFDLKDNTYESKEAFVEALFSTGFEPSKIIDSGNGIHAYWKVEGLDAKSYLRIQRRLMRLFKTDEAVGTLFQLMRWPGTLNVKRADIQDLCSILHESDAKYTAEQLDRLLPAITLADEQFCVRHYNQTHNLEDGMSRISDVLPPKFGELLRDNQEAKRLWSEVGKDRSGSDYRLGHIMFASGFTEDEAISVLVNSAKALERTPVHRFSYAKHIVEKIWTFEITPAKSELSQTIKEILEKTANSPKGTEFRCHPFVDNTYHGYHLGEVLGLVAGSGVGKTAFALNMFYWFTQRNPDYHHFFVPLEQPAHEIAQRWVNMCGKDTRLHDKVSIISNYDDKGNFRHLSFDEIKSYIIEFQKTKSVKAGCVVIDHIGALKKKGKSGEYQDLMDICHSMKAFAVETDTFLVMQSQSSREKAGIGDLELDKNAAYGTVYFESYCDYLMTIWQPLKRCHAEEDCPSVTAFKYCKIRQKNVKRDRIKEDECYKLYFDSETEKLRGLTEKEETQFNFYLQKATNKRNVDKKSGIAIYHDVSEGRSFGDLLTSLQKAN